MELDLVLREITIRETPAFLCGAEQITTAIKFNATPCNEFSEIRCSSGHRLLAKSLPDYEPDIYYLSCSLALLRTSHRRTLESLTDPTESKMYRHMSVSLPNDAKWQTSRSGHVSAVFAMAPELFDQVLDNSRHGFVPQRATLDFVRRSETQAAIFRPTVDGYEWAVDKAENRSIEIEEILLSWDVNYSLTQARR